MPVTEQLLLDAPMGIVEFPDTRIKNRAGVSIRSESMEIRRIMVQNTMNIRHVKTFFRGVLNAPGVEAMIYRMYTGLMAWRPLEKGVLAVDSPDILNKFSDKYNRTPAQVIINWLISQDNVATLSTMRSEKNLRENLGIVGWSLEAEDIEELRAAFPNQEKVSNREPLL